MGGAKTACPPVDTNSQLSSSACRHVTSADDIIDGTCSVKPSHSESQYLALTADIQPECDSSVLASGQRHRESAATAPNNTFAFKLLNFNIWNTNTVQQDNHKADLYRARIEHVAKVSFAMICLLPFEHLLFYASSLDLSL